MKMNENRIKIWMEIKIESKIDWKIEWKMNENKNKIGAKWTAQTIEIYEEIFKWFIIN